MSQVMDSEPFLDCLVLVDTIFSNWKLYFGSKLKARQELDVQTAKLWAAALVMMEVTEVEVETAFLKSLTQLWPPTTPADLLELVRGNHTINFPEACTAYTQTANGIYSHPVCYETAVRVGLWNMRNSPEYATRKAWNEVYPKVCTEYSQDSAKFEQKQLKLDSKKKSDARMADKSEISSQRQLEITMAAIEKIRKL